MTDQTIENAPEAQTQEVDYKALYEQTREKLDIVAAHKDKLYAETKQAKAEKEEAKRQAEEAAQQKAIKDGEYEKLWKAAQEEKKNLENELNNDRKTWRQDRIDATAMRVATDLADGDNAELLSDFVSKHLDKLADERGALSADVIAAVKKEFETNSKYKALLRMSKAAGGGAPGNSDKTPFQPDLSKMSPVDRINAARAGK